MQATVLQAASLILGRRQARATTYAKRIVVIKLDRIGDFILATPFLRVLRGVNPDAWITLVVAANVAPLARECPYVSNVRVAPAAHGGAKGVIQSWFSFVRFAWHELLPLRATEAVLPRWDVDLYHGYSLLRLSGAVRRISYSTTTTPQKSTLNYGANLLLTTVVESTGCKHEVQRNLDLAGGSANAWRDDRLELWIPPQTLEAVRPLLDRWTGRKRVAVCPVSAEHTRDWPFDRFVETMRHFAAASVCFYVCAGHGFEEISRIMNKADLPNAMELVGKLDLLETAALIGQCDVVLTVNTGLMHIAAAQQRRIVALFSWPRDADCESHYSSARFGPWKATADILYPPRSGCSDRAIEAITTASVTCALERALAEQ